jgi:hypothetical protein
MAQQMPKLQDKFCGLSSRAPRLPVALLTGSNIFLPFAWATFGRRSAASKSSPGKFPRSHLTPLMAKFILAA